MIFLLSVVAAVFFPGLILRIKSLLSGRKGPGILQPWKNIHLLLRKGSVISTTTSFIFRLAPVVYLASVLCALLLIPFPGLSSPFSLEADFVLFAYILALGKLLFILGAMDTGSSFEGMGANREALYSMLAEPAFFILMGTLALLTGYTSFSEIFSHLEFGGSVYYIIGIIAVYLLAQLGMIENSRMPVDDPRTHLELTMVHEVMILDYSGVDLAFIQVGTILKMVLYGSLIAVCTIPWSLHPAAWIASFLGVQVVYASGIGFLESFRARKKMARNPQFIVTLSSIAMVAFLLVLLIVHKLIR